jgi:hypothetical protein
MRCAHTKGSQLESRRCPPVVGVVTDFYNSFSVEYPDLYAVVTTDRSWWASSCSTQVLSPVRSWETVVMETVVMGTQARGPFAGHFENTVLRARYS